MRLLLRLGPGHHRRKVDELAVVFRLVVGPDRLHCLDLLAQLLEAGLVDRAVVFQLLGVPAAADPENEPPARDLIERGDELGRLDRVALDDRHTPVASLSRLVATAAALKVTNGSITS
jgi:hypothetical protein